jgi:hypothetical protein
MKPLAALMLGVVAVPAAASVQTPAPADNRAIVVQGIRDPRHSADNYIDKVLPPVFDAQLGRF